MPSEPRWLRVDEIIELNQDLVADTGEPHQLIKPEDLEGACHRPIRLWEYAHEADMVVLATRLMFAVAAAHGFLQGNKRTGFMAGLMFLALNGWSLQPETDGEMLGDFFIDVMNEGLDEAEFVAFLNQHVFERV